MLELDKLKDSDRSSSTLSVVVRSEERLNILLVEVLGVARCFLVEFSGSGEAV